MKKKQKKKLIKLLFSVVIMLFISVAGYFGGSYENIYNHQGIQQKTYQSTSFNVESIPEFQENTPYVVINNNQPKFDEKYFTNECELDELGRCGVAFANIGIDTMPTDERQSISNVKPTGWHTVKYDCVDGKYLYNRCHLIGYQLTAENANKKNLITGTRFMNTQGMLPFENKVAEYIRETKKHVLYRVTPIFEGKNLLANGVQLEAKSIEDEGRGICFNVYIYNNQPNIKIDYVTGKSEYIK